MIPRWLGTPLKAGFLPAILAACLYGDCPAVRLAPGLGSWCNEVIAACGDADTQWMVALCLLMYLGTFLLLQHRREPGGRFWQAGNADLWLGLLAGVASLRYACDYTSASRSTQLLTLIAGMVLGKGAAWLAGVTRTDNARRQGTSNLERRTLNFESDGAPVRTILTTLLILLLVAVFLQNESGRQFQYRGAVRWSGPWDNPNIYGLLMGTGLILALGLSVGSLVQRPRSKVQSGRVGPSVSAGHSGGPAGRTALCGVGTWAAGLFCGIAALVFAVVLLKSYSRGAWVGTALGLGCLAYHVLKRMSLQTGNREPRERREWGLGTCDLPSSRGSRWVSILWRNRLAVVVSLVSVGILLFGALRQGEGRVVRRLASVANENDFSWRNRLAAWEGALQIMADHPWLGAGWNQPELLYTQFYKPPRLKEGMAIQLNDYLTLGMTLGIPAFFCFVTYVTLRLRSKPNDQRPRTPALSPSDGERLPFRAGEGEPGYWPTVCRAGAIVLLLGFWFDGGLFKLPTAVLFWVLLELSGLTIGHGTAETKRRGGQSGLNRWRAVRYPVLAVLVFSGVLLWAKGRDPLRRIWFDVKAKGAAPAECLALLPKNATPPYPTVVYLPGSRGRVISDGAELRQMAELGLAVVTMDYCQTNDGSFESQFAALLRHLDRQPWTDTNALAWVGFSLGAEKVTRFALRHPEAHPQLLVRLAGGELEALRGSRNAERGPRNERAAREGSREATTAPGALNPEPRTANGEPAPRAQHPLLKTLLIHGVQDEVFPVKRAEQVAAVLRAAGVPVELRTVAGAAHDFGVERGVVYRAVGEYCLAQLGGAPTGGSYRSVAQWQADAVPLWAWCLAAGLWAGGWVGRWWRARKRGPAKLRREPLTRGERSFRGLAGALAGMALLCMGIPWLVPRQSVTSGALALARRFLASPAARVDFDWLAAQPLWQGQRVKTVLDHAELASYNRQLVNWKLDESAYRDFVLSPEITAGDTGGLRWHRPLWESLYPRIRKEQSPGAAAQVVVRHLRERVTLLPQAGPTADLAAAWLAQRADATGFAQLCVAALRAVGIAARLDHAGEAEFWNGTAWEPVPRPSVGVWLPSTTVRQ